MQDGAGVSADSRYDDILSRLENKHGVPRLTIIELDVIVGERLADLQESVEQAVSDFQDAAERFLKHTGRLV